MTKKHRGSPASTTVMIGIAVFIVCILTGDQVVRGWAISIGMLFLILAGVWVVVKEEWEKFKKWLKGKIR